MLLLTLCGNVCIQATPREKSLARSSRSQFVTPIIGNADEIESQNGSLTVIESQYMGFYYTASIFGHKEFLECLLCFDVMAPPTVHNHVLHFTLS